jgi:hypothetical protein
MTNKPLESKGAMKRSQEGETIENRIGKEGQGVTFERREW